VASIAEAAFLFLDSDMLGIDRFSTLPQSSLFNAI
jgi:hypothetical protein